MKTIEQLRKQYLDEHHEQYVAFTRLLVTISVAFLTLLATVIASEKMPSSWLFRLSVSSQLISLVFGLIVQHQIMMSTINHLLEVEKAAEEAEAKGEGEPVEMRRKPSTIQQIAYRWQLAFFVLSFVLVAGYLVSA